VSDLPDLLAAVAANPDDDAALSVLGDWFAQQGDPRGELIGLELAPPTKETKARIRALMKEHAPKWLAPFQKLSAGLTFGIVRGLVGHVRGSPELLARFSPTIVAKAATVHDVDVMLASSGDVSALAGSPLLAKARRVMISSAGRKLAGAGALELPACRELVFEAVALGPEELAAVVANAPRLAKLKLHAGRLNKKAEEPLAGLADRLVELDMPAYHLGPTFGQLLGAFTKLSRLAIAGADLTDVGIRALLPALGGVEVLDLRGNELSLKMLPELLRELSAIRELELGGNPLGDHGAIAIASWPRATQLERLHLGNAQVTNTGALALAASANLANLTSLVLSGARFAETTNAALVESPHLARAQIYAGDRFLAR